VKGQLARRARRAYGRGVTGALLLFEPEQGSREYLARNLRDDGFEVLGAARNREALDLVERARPDLVVATGIELCSRLREGEPGRTWDRNVPVIVVTQPSSDPVDRVRALERGADDVLERPVAYLELVARIRAILRRTAGGGEEWIAAGDIVVDRRTRRVLVRGVPVELAGREFELAARLATDPTRVWTKGELLRDVWGFRSDGLTRTVDSHACRLRRKLRRNDTDRFVVNVWGVGYRLLE
jgi:DNA-binding response OmpR family regulator